MNIVLLLFTLTAVVTMNVLRGGVWLWLSLPCYAVLAAVGVISFFKKDTAWPAQRAIICLTASSAFFGYIVIRTCVSPVEHLARNDLFMVLGGLIVYGTSAIYLATANLRATLIVALLALAIANTAVGAIQFTAGDNFALIKALQREGYGSRASGFFGNPNHLAGFLEVTFLLGLALTFWSRWPIWAKILLGYGSLVCLAGIAITGSRGGYISTLVGFLVLAGLSLLIISRQRFDRLGFVIGTVGVATVFAGFAAYLAVREMPVLQTRVQTTTTFDDSRMRMWPSALQQFQLNPVFGTGSATFTYYGREFRDPGFQMDPTYVHNDYLQLLAEFGIIGVVGFLIFLIFHLRSGWKTFGETMAAHNPFEGVSDTAMALNVGALSSVAAIIVHSCVDFNLHIPANALLLAFVFGILANPGNALATAKTESPRPLPVPARLVLPALGAWIIFAGWPVAPGDYFAWKARVALGDWTTLETGEYAVRAADFARRGLAYDSKNTELLTSLGDALFAQTEVAGDSEKRDRLLQESIDVYQRALKLAPRDRNIVLALGWSLDAMKRFDESEPVFARALALDPNSGQVHWAQAAHFHLRGKRAEARAAYEKAVALGAGWSAHNGLHRLNEEEKAAAPADKTGNTQSADVTDPPAAERPSGLP